MPHSSENRGSEQLKFPADAGKKSVCVDIIERAEIIIKIGKIVAHAESNVFKNFPIDLDQRTVLHRIQQLGIPQNAVLEGQIPFPNDVEIKPRRPENISDIKGIALGRDRSASVRQLLYRKC